MMGRMERRFFVAIPLPENVKSELRYALDRVEESILSCGRVIPEENWHITLKFLGNRSEEDVPRIIDAMESVLRKTREKPENLFIENLTFDDHRPPRIVWAEGRKESSDALGVLRNLFDGECAARGIERRNDRAGFTMHVSLVRLFRNPPRDAYVQEPVYAEFPVESLDLMESNLKKSGAEYVLVKRIFFREAKGAKGQSRL